MSALNWAAFQRDLLLLFQPLIYWLLIGLLVGAVLLAIMGAFIQFMDGRIP